MVSYWIGCGVWRKEELMMSWRLWPEGLWLTFLEMGMTEEEVGGWVVKSLVWTSVESAVG